MKKTLCLLLGALLAALAVPALAQGPVKIGLILPMTGPAAPYGDMAYRGVLLAQEHRPTVLGRKVRLVLVDNKSDKVEASNAAQRLIVRDQVPVIIGPLSSGTTLAAAPVAERLRVPLVSGWATNPVVTKGKKHVFRTCFIDPFQGRVAANFAVHNLKAKTAAVLIDVSRDYSVGLAGFFMLSFKKLGGKVVLVTKYSAGDQEFGAQVGAIKSAGPDLIYLPGYFPELPMVIRQAREQGLGQPFLSGDAAQSDETLKLTGQYGEGLYLTTHFDEQGSPTRWAAAT